MEELLKQHTFAAHAVAAAGSVALASSLTQPLDTLKTLLQVGAGSRQQLDLSQVLDRVRSVSGISGLYSGFGWSTVGKVLGIGARFGTFEVLTAFYKDGREDNYVYVSEALLAGSTAGAVEAVVSTPFELFKLREQVNAASQLLGMRPGKVVESTPVISKLLPGYMPDRKGWGRTVGLLSALPKHSGMVDALKSYPWMLTGSGRPPLASEVKSPLSVISLEGWGAMWRGLRSGIARDSIFSGVFFSTWQFLHIAMLDWKAIDMDPLPRSYDEIGPVSPLAASLAAGFSGLVAALASHCFDTAKTRSQCIVTPKGVDMDCWTPTSDGRSFESKTWGRRRGVHTDVDTCICAYAHGIKCEGLNFVYSIKRIKKYITMERKFLRWNVPGMWIERVTGISPRDRSILFRGIGLRMTCSGFASLGIVGGYLLAVDHLF